jgi:peptidoglycan hydrolase CwlO-like protein
MDEQSILNELSSLRTLITDLKTEIYELKEANIELTGQIRTLESTINNRL